MPSILQLQMLLHYPCTYISCSCLPKLQYGYRQDFVGVCILLMVIIFMCQVMELELKKLMDTVNSIHEEMFYLRDR